MGSLLRLSCDVLPSIPPTALLQCGVVPHCWGCRSTQPDFWTESILVSGKSVSWISNSQFPRRRKRVRPCHAGRRRPQAPDGQRCLLKCLYKTCGYGECRNGKCVEN